MFPGILASWLATYGYGAVWIGVLLESAGIPFPGETMLRFSSMGAKSSSSDALSRCCACGRLSWQGSFTCAGLTFSSATRLRAVVWATGYGLGGYLLGTVVNRLAGPLGWGLLRLTG
jgi:membrane protein DedA with SNARE-associated domain